MKVSNTNQTQFSELAIGLSEAALFLGFKNTERLRQKAKQGCIPGAFKIGREWRFYKPTLVAHVENLYSAYGKITQVDMRGNHLCQSAKRNVVRTIGPDSPNVEFEYKNLLGLQPEPKRELTRKKEEMK